MPRTSLFLTLPATPPQRGPGWVLAPATSSTTIIHPSPPPFSWSVPEAPRPHWWTWPKQQDSWALHSGAVKQVPVFKVSSGLFLVSFKGVSIWLRPDSQEGRDASLGKREWGRVREDPRYLRLLNQAYHISESPFPLLWDDNKIISILPYRPVLKAQRRKCTESTLKSVNRCGQEPPLSPWLGVRFLARCASACVERELEERKRPRSWMGWEGGKWVVEKHRAGQWSSQMQRLWTQRSPGLTCSVAPHQLWGLGQMAQPNLSFIKWKMGIILVPSLMSCCEAGMKYYL